MGRLATMAASAPTHFGHYEIVSLLGKGGMGEVWKARDPRLNREVAIKVSAQQFTDRFEREARAIAALNHANICTLYDVGPNYLVMESVEGPTLAERIAHGPVPLEEALGIAKQIADALEAAHEKGIVHRDLKPANIKIRPDGSVKVLDFGLALTEPRRQGSVVDSPTLPLNPTEAGMILGTAAYMSPEQARGKPVDKRADIWAFGVVLYEMVTGKRLFEGETVSDTLAAVIKEEPDWERVPARVQRLLRRCLEKDAKRRLRDIGDAMLLLDTEPTTNAPWRSRRGTAGWIAAGVVAFLAATLAFIHFREEPPKTPVVRSIIPPPAKMSFRFDAPPYGLPALSPDSSRLVFGAQSSEGSGRLWVRPLNATTAQPLAGTEGASFSYPFWSPDGRSIGFSADGKLKKIELSGGPAVTLADAPSLRGGSWSPQGVILFAPSSVGPLHRVQIVGGMSTPVTVIDPARKENSHRWPWFLPDGRHFLYTAVVTNSTKATIYVGSLDSRETHIVEQANSNAVYASGYLLFLRDNALMAQPFDTKRLTTTADAVSVGEQIGDLPAAARGFFAVSDAGTLVFQSGLRAGETLVWLDRAGKRLATAGEPGQLMRTSVSPDGKRAAVSVYGHAAHDYDLWIYDLARNRRSRFTFGSANENGAVWSPDGSQLVFSDNRKGHLDLYRKLASGAGAEELLYADGLAKFPTSWSRDGKFLMYYSTSDSKTGQDLWVLPLDGERKPFPFLKTEFNELYGQFSPDGRWVAYASDQSGNREIYVAPIRGQGGKRQVSVAGGTLPRWRADSKEVFYIAPDGRLMSAEIGTKGADVEIGTVRPLFRAGFLPNVGGYPYDVSPDGQRFLAIMPDEQVAPEPLTLVQNWTAGLKK
jgi:eukaryotic-like serine/threonine-protein kinase